MSYLQTLLTACPDIQDQLDTYFQTNGTSRGVIDEAMPLLQFIVNNDGGLAQRVHSSQNKVRQVDLLYTQFITEDQVTEVSGKSCTATEERGDCSKSYTIDTTDQLNVNQRVTQESLQNNCQDNAEYFLEVISRMIDVMDRKVATKTANDAVALLGGWSTDTLNVVADTLQVKTLKDGTTDELAPFTTEEVQTAFETSKFNSNTLVVGGQTLHNYMKKLQNGCCANQGLDLGAMFSQFAFASAWDKRVVNAAGGNEFSWALQAGALQLLQWTSSRWKEGAIGDIQSVGSYVSMVVRSPKTGVAYDLTINDTCEELHFNLNSTTKVVDLPDDMFPTGSDYDGVKWFAPIEVVNV